MAPGLVQQLDPACGPACRHGLPQVVATGEPTPSAAPEAAGAGFRPEKGCVSVLLEFLGDPADLEALGALPVARAGDIVAAYANLDAIPALRDHGAVLQLDPGGQMPPPVLPPPAPAGGDSGGEPRDEPEGEPEGNPGDEPGSDPAPRPAAPGDAAMPAAAPAAGETGRGVRLGIIDLGFDFLHPGLLDHEGGPAPRALWLHDMTLSPLPDAVPGTIGRRFRRAALREALAWYRAGGPPASQGERPDPGEPAALEHLRRLAFPPERISFAEARQRRLHGTAVAGLAAGNGRRRMPGLPGRPARRLRTGTGTGRASRARRRRPSWRWLPSPGSPMPTASRTISTCSPPWR
ncbi:hypothetical protein M0638_06705 [Roseomonas sp. NAR14]|uniref:Peptidase S8/S53 domain-containing protein n=1 Tax=Roseomonas acroporae TaxID=2937791 RepID=A0A9X1Y5Y6_9PROT|nr:hypothetical protein [Roseomonas acroporae]MCK8784068.1 hypothetical protein [Roseomonas acroporae]